MRSKSAIFKNLCIVFLTFVIVFLCLEVILRSINISCTQTQKKFYVYDSLLGWRLKPNTSGIFKTNEFKIPVKINSKGIRDSEHKYKKKGERILFLGDSFTWGWGVDIDNTIPKIVEKETGIETINMGCPSYGTDQEYLIFKEEGWKYSPDIVILCFLANDFWDNILNFTLRGYGKPKFEIVNEKLVLKNVPVPIPENFKKKFALFSFLEAHFYTYSFLENLIYKNKLLNKKRQIPSWFNYEYIYYKNPPEIIKESIEVTGRILREINMSALKKNVKFIVVYLPSKEQFSISSKKEINYSLPHLYIQEICHKENIKFLSLYPLFKKTLGGKKIEEFYFKDGHFNKKGYLTAGKIIAEFLKKEVFNKRIF